MGRVLVKFGGGVITTKSTGEPDIRWDVLKPLIRSTFDLASKGHQVIVVHGAGSFGHVLAKKWDLSSGFESDKWGRTEKIVQDRMVAVAEVRENMDYLRTAIVSAGYCKPHIPREFMKNTGFQFDGDLTRFTEVDEVHNTVHITHGDLVDCDEPKGFGILSGDHIMYRLATELPDVTHCIFAMDEQGILTRPEEGDLIPCWNRDMGLNGVHDDELDVTGGIFLKADVASRICETVEHVWFVDGKCPERITEIVENGDTIGTRIVPP